MFAHRAKEPIIESEYKALVHRNMWLHTSPQFNVLLRPGIREQKCSRAGTELRHALVHKIEEGELTSVDAIAIDEATGQIASEDCANVVVRYLMVC